MAADTPSGAETLEQVFALTREDLRLVLTARRPENRLGLALVLLWTRAERQLPGELTALPATVIVVVARQLGLAPALVQQYGQRPATRSAHAAQVCAHLGVRPFSAVEERRLRRYLQVKVAQTGNLAVLRPGGGTTLDRLVTGVRGETEEALFRQVAAPLGDAARAQLDQLCCTDAGTSVLADLATPPRQASAVAIRQECRRLAQLRAAVPSVIPWEAVTANRRRQWAAIVRRLSAQAVRRYPPEKRATLLLAFLEVRAEEVTDDLIEMYDAVLSGIFADSRAEVAAVQLAHAQEQVDVLRDFRAIAEVLLDPAIAAEEVRPEAFRRVPRHRVSAFMEGSAPPDHGDGPAFFAALRRHFRHLREFLPLLLTTVAFASPRADSELLPALAVLRTLHAERRRIVPADAPVDFVPKKWRKVVVGVAGIDRHAWEFCFAEQVRLALRAGDLTVIGSRRYTPWDAGLYTGERWRQRRATWYAEQGLPEDGAAFVRQRKDRLHALTTKIAGRLPQNAAVQIEQGKLRLTALEQINLPAEALQARQALTQVLPLVDLPGLLMEVDHWTGFSAALTRLGARQEPGAERLGSVRAALFAVLVAEATNLGLATMARAAGIPEGQLTRVYDWYFREDTLRAAITRLVHYHHSLPLSRRFGSGTTSSSDGIRFGVASSTLSARHLPRYFGVRRGLTVYGHVLDQGPWFWVNVINCLVRDSTYVLDGLVYQDAPRIQVHYADTHGYSDLVFGLFDLLGFRFAPRLPGTRRAGAARSGALSSGA